MPFIRNLWYVAAWDNELAQDAPIGRTIIGEPIVLYRQADGTPVALEDRCPHRHAPLSLGRVEGDDLRCMYHGLKFDRGGRCREIPGASAIPSTLRARHFPVVEKGSWIWVWMGDPARADPATLPELHGLASPDWVMRDSAMDYDADYELINDNLCDLSHLDFVHETTLGAAAGTRFSNDQPRITPIDGGLLVERWLVDHTMAGGDMRVDTHNTYRYLLPGVFLMDLKVYPHGAAEAHRAGRLDSSPLFERTEQQAVTPISARRTRYFFASGAGRQYLSPGMIDRMFAVVNDAFAEDRRMIEGQQRIWDLTPASRQKAFIPQDKGPHLFRRLISARLREEDEEGAPDEVSRSPVRAQVSGA